jgi:hypothetical protein
VSDPVKDLKRELVAAADRRHAPASVPGGAARRRLARSPLLVGAATVTIAAAVALVFTAPWSESPTFLERAEAALAPRAGTILHEKWEATVTSSDPVCTVTRGPNEIWIDQASPYRFRALLDGYPLTRGADPRTLVCASGTTTEVGGTRMETLMFVPPNTLSIAPVHYLPVLDPVADLRQAINGGRAHDEGRAELDGRTVERIRIDPPSDCPDPNCPREPTYAYVDPETFYPVRVESPHGYIVDDSVVRFHFVLRILTFEYLPRTAANLALTDIQAQHPDAIGP